ncbi:MAG: hypothetical protein IJY79_09260 [Clostridia bacterium]|nr:hypothetical protein [Clostridia bacterium]MBQ8741719.1 hypothetical protein [Clostridia bacterium]
MKTFEETIERLNKISLEHALHGLHLAGETLVKALASNEWQEEFDKYFNNYCNYRHLVHQMLDSEIYSDMVESVEYIPIHHPLTYDYIKVTWKK